MFSRHEARAWVGRCDASTEARITVSSQQIDSLILRGERESGRVQTTTTKRAATIWVKEAHVTRRDDQSCERTWRNARRQGVQQVQSVEIGSVDISRTAAVRPRGHSFPPPLPHTELRHTLSNKQQQDDDSGGNGIAAHHYHQSVLSTTHRSSSSSLDSPSLRLGSASPCRFNKLPTYPEPIDGIHNRASYPTNEPNESSSNCASKIVVVVVESVTRGDDSRATR